MVAHRRNQFKVGWLSGLRLSVANRASGNAPEVRILCLPPNKGSLSREILGSGSGLENRGLWEHDVRVRIPGFPPVYKIMRMHWHKSLMSCPTAGAGWGTPTTDDWSLVTCLHCLKKLRVGCLSTGRPPKPTVRGLNPRQPAK